MTAEREAMRNLVENKGFDASSIQPLEAYVQKQCETDEYDLEANLALLRLYQFFPEKLNSQHIGRILIKALSHLPNTDFLLCTYLIPENLHEEEPVASLSTLAADLETGNFVKFWEDATACEELLRAVPSFHSSVRTFIIHVIQNSYHVISMSEFCRFVNTDEAEAKKLAGAAGWKIDADKIVIPREDDNKGKGSSSAFEAALNEDNMIKALRVTINDA